MNKIDIRKRKNDNLTFGQYDYKGLAHWWVYNYGKGNTGGYYDGTPRMSALYNAIYSYKFMIAKMYPSQKGDSSPFILIANGNFSGTTQKHIRAVKNATAGMTVLGIQNIAPNTKEDHCNNLKKLYEEIVLSVGKFCRAKSDNKKKEYLDTYYKKRYTIVSYATYFKLRKHRFYKRAIAIADPSNKYSKEEFSAFRDKVVKIEEKERRKKDKEKRERHTKRVKEAESILQEWLKGGNRLPDEQYLSETYLRVKGAVVETTECACINLKSSIEALRKYKEGTLKKGDSISGFKFKGISDGYAQIGCHSVSMKEINRVLSMYRIWWERRNKKGV